MQLKVSGIQIGPFLKDYDSNLQQGNFRAWIFCHSVVKPIPDAES